MIPVMMTYLMTPRDTSGDTRFHDTNVDASDDTSADDTSGDTNVMIPAVIPV